MKSTTTFIVATLAVAALLAGCSANTPTAPKPTAIPAFTLSVTPETTTATTGDSVLVVAQVTTGGGNAPDGTAVTFNVTGGVFPPSGATEATRTTSGGRAAVDVTTDSPGRVVVLARVKGGSAATAVVFSGTPPTPTPTGPPDYTPQIYALTPNAGPFEGGTQVVITGTGFQDPVQVLFGARQAQVVSASYTEIHCVAPSIAPDAPKVATTVSVTVTNTQNGKVSTGKDYTYGVTMFISGFSPTEGAADVSTPVTIFGQGFVGPVSVIFGSGATAISWTVTSVAGTEIVATAVPVPDSARTCGDLGALVTVTNLGSNTNAVSTQMFTYRALRPLITSVQIDGGGNTVPQYLAGTCNTAWSTHTVTIHGSGFQQFGGVSAMTASFGGLAAVPTTFVDANTLTLTLPDLTGIPLSQVPCNDGGGSGFRNVATPVDVTVGNLRNSCVNTLNGAIVINPCITTCVVAPPTPTPAPPTPTPTPTAPPTWTLTLTRTLNAPGDGTITANPGGFVCPSTCAPTFANNTNVSLTAAVTTGTFGGWAGACASCGTTLTCSVLMDASKGCTATFNP